MANEKFCTKCGKKFIATGREVICPTCREAAAEATKKAAVLKAKKASWNGESVPVRISGRASTVIREYGKANNLPFAQALDGLLKSTPFFINLGVEWSTIVPYKSRRRDKHTTEDATETTQEVKRAAQEVKQEEVKTAQAAKSASKTTSKTVKKVATAAAGKKVKA